MRILPISLLLVTAFLAPESSCAPTTSNLNDGFMQAKHHNYAEMTSKLKILADKHPALAKLYSVGKSVQGRELWVIQVSASL